VVNVGGDARAPRNPASPDDRLASFDLTVEKPAGTLQRSVEVTTVLDPISAPAELTAAVRHATDKVMRRQVAGYPVPGYVDVTIRIQIHPSKRTGSGRLFIDSSGHIELETANGRHIPKGNLFDDVAPHLSSIPSHQHLDRIALVDAASGRLLAEYQRAGNLWTRIK
jgi:hypothetical protein